MMITMVVLMSMIMTNNANENNKQIQVQITKQIQAAECFWVLQCDQRSVGCHSSFLPLTNRVSTGHCPAYVHCPVSTVCCPVCVEDLFRRFQEFQDLNPGAVINKLRELGSFAQMADTPSPLFGKLLLKKMGENCDILV